MELWYFSQPMSSQLPRPAQLPCINWIWEVSTSMWPVSWAGAWYSVLFLSLYFFGDCPLVLLVLNAKSHWFWRQNLRPIIIWVYCYSAMSSISPSRNTVRHSGLISYCTAINDSMWHRAQGLKIWLLQRLGFHSHLTPALLQMTRIRTREVGMKCLIINIRPPGRMKASVFNKRTVLILLWFYFIFFYSTIRL